MIICHIESGLGNQMLDYVDAVALKIANPSTEIYIENIVYELGDVQNKISMWNGYELNRIFGIEEKNIRSLFSDKEWADIVDEVRESQFWTDNWTYSKSVVKALKGKGINLQNLNDRPLLSEISHFHKFITEIKRRFINSRVGYSMHRFKYKYIYKVDKNVYAYEQIYKKHHNNVYGGHWLSFHKCGGSNKYLDDIIKKIFIFPKFIDKRNIELHNQIITSNSVSIHVRLGDASSYNFKYIKFGYFRRAVKLIKNKVDKPKFFIFTNEGTFDYILKNQQKFGLNTKTDQIIMVNWNNGLTSFRDMQLMSMCKNNIIVESSFGWWAAFLNQYPNKITISPDPRFRTTHFL